MLTFPLRRWIGNGRLIFMLMLLTLHLALWAGVDSIWARPLLFTHLGLFLMWQPLWRGEEKLGYGSAFLIVGMSTAALFWLNWWLLAFWVSGLFSLVGGRVFAFQASWQRFRYLLAMGYLLSVLLFWLTPQLFLLPITNEASRVLMEALLPMVLFVLALLPAEQERLKKNEVVDLVYSLMLFMLLALLVLGSLTFMSLAHVNYFESLLRTLFLMGILLFVLGWLWNPRLGFSGFQTIFSRYFMSIGTPFETWVKQLATAAQEDISPEAFLEVSTGFLAENTWLCGLAWSCDGAQGMQGEAGKNDFTWVDRDVRLKLYAKTALAPAVLMHLHLLCQVLAHFYHAKRSEEKLREMLRLQAVHETGARVSHDLKNMLQSLMVLISVVDQQPEQARGIATKQLPMLAKRIEAALAKFRSTPLQSADQDSMPVAEWWKGLRERYHYRNLEWECGSLNEATVVPVALLDNIVDNLIENARGKRDGLEEIRILISLNEGPFRLRVCDSGQAVPDSIAARLTHTVVDSEEGWGVGLFQAARWAEKLGYSLVLAENEDGRVCFELSLLNR